MDEFEYIRFDNCKVTVQTVGSLRCLEDIKDSIAVSGGRAMLAYIISNEEAPEWFDKKHRTQLRNRVERDAWQKGMLKRRGNSHKEWTWQEIEYIFTHWLTRDHRWIAKSLDRKASVIRRKARELMKPEMYNSRVYNRLKVGKSSN